MSLPHHLAGECRATADAIRQLRAAWDRQFLYGDLDPGAVPLVQTLLVDGLSVAAVLEQLAALDAEGVPTLPDAIAQRILDRPKPA